MMTLRETLRKLASERQGSVLLEDSTGGEWLPSDLLRDLEGDEAGRTELGRAVAWVEIDRPASDVDSMIAYTNTNGRPYPNEPCWYVKHSASNETSEVS